MKVPLRQSVSEKIINQRPGRAVLFIGVGCECNTSAVKGYALNRVDSNVRAHRHASSAKRAEEGALRHDTRPAPLQTSARPLKDVDGPVLADEQVAGQDARHRTSDYDGFFHVPLYRTRLPDRCGSGRDARRSPYSSSLCPCLDKLAGCYVQAIT